MDKLGKVIAFHPRRSSLINLYEVVGEDGNAEWGGNDPQDVMSWYRLAPSTARILVSAWESDEEDAQLIGQPVDITDLILKAMEVGR